MLRISAFNIVFLHFSYRQNTNQKPHPGQGMPCKSMGVTREMVTAQTDISITCKNHLKEMGAIPSISVFDPTYSNKMYHCSPSSDKIAALKYDFYVIRS